MQQVDIYRSEADAAYQGAPGAYSEEAARALLGADARLMPCATLEQTFEAVADGRADHAVVAVENALSGTFPQVYELLLTSDLTVTGETITNLDHVLIAPRGAELRNVRRVLSHPLALAQCSDFLRQNRGIEAVSVFDTAGAVRLIVQSGDKSTAAIASRRAAELYDADVLAEHIQDHRDNWTRFLLLSRRGDEPGGGGRPAQGAVPDRYEKAIVAFGLRHEPGSLVAALTPIAAHGLSVTKIEGRPIAGKPFDSPDSPLAHVKPFEYRFVVEIAAPIGGVIPDAAYDELRAATTWFKPLGAFHVQ